MYIDSVALDSLLGLYAQCTQMGGTMSQNQAISLSKIFLVLRDSIGVF